MENFFDVQAQMICKLPFIIKLNDIEGDFDIEKELVFKPANVGTYIRLVPLMIKIKGIDDLLIDVESGMDLLNKSVSLKLSKKLELVDQNFETVIKIICLSYWNKQDNYPEWYPNFFIQNFSIQNVLFVLDGIIKRLDLSAFFVSIAQIRKASPVVAEEMIALQKEFSIQRN